jgi:KDO2-lipid IV(A) lauroyltransferase
MVKRYIEYFLFFFIVNLIKIFPLSIAYYIGKLLGKIGYFILPKYRKKAFRNLMIAFPKFSKRKVKEITYLTFQNFGKSFVEFFLFSNPSRDYLKKYVTIEGINYLKEALEKKKGIIIFSAHLGNWELIPLTFSLMGYPMSILTKKQRNKYINEMINKVRRREGIEIIESAKTPKRIIKLLQEGKILGIVGDQSKFQGVKVNFFGKPIMVAGGAGAFVLHYKVILIPTFDIREEDNRHRIIIEKPLVLEEEEISVEEIMKRLMEKVESYVKRYPEQWIWWYHQWGKEER